eukprot:CAMPEP_0119319048 /NCGR_PEP_ID=MMETSP1333-20130426/48342_1 /TAXON_ID=418940 /ORGANISM="Scyphosphaera apsteinii, Strain RCC1455" /LENGTH=75 /DNA_ID=CAMNT_0007325371 /DNA_START=208 /DNA_END=431 /DNA_ORIENTATION=-
MRDHAPPSETACDSMATKVQQRALRATRATEGLRHALSPSHTLLSRVQVGWAPLRSPHAARVCRRRCAAAHALQA